MTLAIEHDCDQHRFTVLVEARPCLLEYRLAGTVMTIIHTGVPEVLRGRGIAAELARMAFETARAQGWKVVPACSYALQYAHKHPEYADLLA